MADRSAHEQQDSKGRLEGDKLLTVNEVAAWISFTPKGVYALVEGRRLPFIKISNRLRFLRSDVLAFLTENRVPASERGR